MNQLYIAVLLGLTAGAATIIGGLIISGRNWAHASLRYFLAIGSGFMLATSVLEMIPASFALMGARAAAFVLLGYLLVHFFEHSIHSHFHFGEETHHEELMHPGAAASVIGGMAIHSFFDGIAITSGFLVSHWLGYIIFLAVLLHKVPEGFTAASVVMAAGRTRSAAFAGAVVLGAATVAGVLTMAAARSHVGYGLPLSAGVTLYVAATDIVPEVNKEPGIAMPALLFAGVALMFLLDALFHAH